MQTINIYSVKQVKEKGGRYDLDKNIRSPEDAFTIIQTVLDLNSEVVEKFGIITLNAKNAIAGIHILSTGTLNAALIHPRNIFQAAILNNAGSIVLFHNHPSGDPTPSREDIQLTERLISAGEMMGIPVIDHIIAGDGAHVSLRESGYI